MVKTKKSGSRKAEDLNPRLSVLRARIAKAPTGPGVYTWMGEDGEVLYVGKAKNLRNRLRSYVNPKNMAAQGPWKLSFLRQIADFDVTVTNTELEALMFETNLIKQLRPKYNVLMKDDKDYLFIRVTAKDAYPFVETVRKFAQDPPGRGRAGGAKYFGPFLSSDQVRKQMDLLQEALHYRACRKSVDAHNRDATVPLGPACFESQIGLCNGLCAGKIDCEEYRRRIDGVVEFLKGDEDAVRALLCKRMAEAAQAKKFELAAKLRDYLGALEAMPEPQIATDTSGEDADIIAVAILSCRAHVTVLRRRSGKLVGDHSMTLRGQAETPEEVLEQFLPQYYAEVPEVPPEIVVSHELPEAEVLEAWLSQTRGGRVDLVVPSRGRKSQLLELAQKNVQEKARQEEVKWEAEKRNTTEALADLMEVLKLPRPPKRIEGYDISHLGGTETVGSMVVIQNGKAANDQYRSFTIHTMKKGEVDDYRALTEVLRRRLRHLSGGFAHEEEEWGKQGVKFGKARKGEMPMIEENAAATKGRSSVHISQQHPFAGAAQAVVPKSFLIARHEDAPVSFIQIFKHHTGLLELKSPWIEESWQGSRIGQFLVRLALRGLKKEKIYVVIDPALEQSYGELGFRHVFKVPPALQGMDQDKIVLVYDATQHKEDSSLSDAPDLLVIDGGKGQLNTALEVLREQKLEIPVIGLAKREEEVFIPGHPAPVSFGTDSPAKFLLMRLRDEAHRFANRHREKRGLRETKRSLLDTIPSIGPDTKKALLKKFHTIDQIRYAKPELLREMLTEEQYEQLKRVLSEE